MATVLRHQKDCAFFKLEEEIREALKSLRTLTENGGSKQEILDQISVLEDLTKIIYIEGGGKINLQRFKRPFKARQKGKLCDGIKKTRTEYDDGSSSDGSVCGVPLPCINKESDFHAVLRENHVELVDSLQVSDMMDHLLQGAILSQSDSEIIRSQPCEKARARQLLFTISRYGRECIKSFINTLPKSNHTFLHRKLQESIKRRNSGPKDKQTEHPMCLYCQIVANVEIRDVIDVLYAKSILNLEMCSGLKVCDSRDKLREWSKILQQVRKHSCSGIKALKQALDAKYSYIAEKIDGISPEQLQCICTVKRKTVIGQSEINKLNAMAEDVAKNCIFRANENDVKDAIEHSDSDTVVKQISRENSLNSFGIWSQQNLTLCRSESDDSITHIKERALLNNGEIRPVRRNITDKHASDNSITIQKEVSYGNDNQNVRDSLSVDLRQLSNDSGLSDPATPGENRPCYFVNPESDSQEYLWNREDLTLSCELQYDCNVADASGIPLLCPVKPNDSKMYPTKKYGYESLQTIREEHLYTQLNTSKSADQEMSQDDACERLSANQNISARKQFNRTAFRRKRNS